MKRTLITVFLVLAIRCPAFMTDVEIAETLDAVFRRDMGYDGPLRPRRLTVQGMAFAEAYSNVIVRSEWSVESVEGLVVASVSNRCADAAFLSSGRNRSAYRGAVAALGRHGVTNALPALEYAFLNSVATNVVEEALSIVALRGSGHDAFEGYARLLASARGVAQARIGDLTLAVSSRLCGGDCPDAIRRRAVRFFLDVAMEMGVCDCVSDQSICDLWPAYAESSNRYEMVAASVGQCENLAVGNYLNEVRARLLALPPGTMQMLSTNQFYNVED